MLSPARHLIVNASAWPGPIPLADRSVHCVVTSPPYWALRSYLKADDPRKAFELGCEPTPAGYVARMVAVFAEVHRVLRDDGTLWLNCGDSYANDTKWGGSGAGPASKNYTSGLGDYTGQKVRRKTGLKPKDLCMVPARLAIALQEWGWTLRAEIVWAKRSPMPESVRDRPTRAHEMVYLFTKGERYFYDQDSERVAMPKSSIDRYAYSFGGDKSESFARMEADGEMGGRLPDVGDRQPIGDGRNLWSYWTDIRQSPSSIKHYAIMPADLARRCIRLGTSERGVCPHCGSPWRRIVDRDRKATRPGVKSKVYEEPPLAEGSPYRRHAGDICGNRDPQRHCTATRTKGWEPTCSCPAADPVPAVVFDPFGGAGTTLLAARQLGRHGVMCELSPKNCELAARRLRRELHPQPKLSLPEPLPGQLELAF